MHNSIAWHFNWLQRVVAISPTGSSLGFRCCTIPTIPHLEHLHQFLYGQFCVVLGWGWVEQSIFMPVSFRNTLDVAISGFWPFSEKETGKSS